MVDRGTRARLFRGAIALVALAAMVSACARRNVSAGPDGVMAVGTLYPLAYVAERVGGERATVANLTPAGAEPHDIELGSAELDALLDADVVFLVGEGFQPAVQEVVASREGESVDVLEGRRLRMNHEEGGVDPHVWLDPLLMIEIVADAALAFARVDPDGRATFEANARELEDDLRALDGDYSQGLADCERQTIVTAHASFGYLADRYGLTQHAISGLSPEAEPDPERLAELADMVRDEGITTVFTEELLPADVAETLAREAGVRTAVLSPLEGLTAGQEAEGATYERVMRENLAALRGALGCT